MIDIPFLWQYSQWVNFGRFTQRLEVAMKQLFGRKTCSKAGDSPCSAEDAQSQKDDPADGPKRQLSGVVPLTWQEANTFIRVSDLAATKRSKHASLVLQVFFSWLMALKVVVGGHRGSWIGNFAPVSPPGQGRLEGRIAIAATVLLAAFMAYLLETPAGDRPETSFWQWLLFGLAHFGMYFFLSAFLVANVGKMLYQDLWIPLRFRTAVDYLERDLTCTPRYLGDSHLRRKLETMARKRAIIDRTLLLSIFEEVSRIASNCRPTRWMECAYGDYQRFYIPAAVSALVQRIAVMNPDAQFRVLFHRALAWEFEATDPDFPHNELFQTWHKDNKRLFLNHDYGLREVVVAATVPADLAKDKPNDRPSDDTAICPDTWNVVAMFWPDFSGNQPAYSAKLAEITV